MIKGLAKRQKVKEEKQLKNNYCYDRSLGHYWKLRRELTNEEWMQSISGNGMVNG